MKRLLWFMLFFNLIISYAPGQSAGPFRTTFFDPDTLPRPFKAFLMSQTPNLVIYSANRYIKHSDFAYINGHSITMNFMFTSLWDNDLFGTNLLGHPFHGSMDYSGARVSGMNHWQAFPYTFGASFVWEFILENEPASFNDQIATSVGGSLLGEVSFRLSSSIVDNRATGVERVVREIFGALTCPMNGINRLITGEMWKRRNYPHATSKNIFPITFGAELSGRYMTSLTESGTSRWSPLLKGWFSYGDPFRIENERPFDYFEINFGLDLASSDNLLARVNAKGMLKGNILSNQEHKKSLWGWFQHFTYMENDVMGKDSIPPFRYSEPASLGIGYLFQKNDPSGNKFNSESYLNAIILGAAQASYFNLKGRKYNFGQGYGVKLRNSYSIRERLTLGLNLDFSQLFTWKGYKKGIVVSEQDYRKLNAMGDRGFTLITMINPYMRLNINRHLSLHIDTNFFLQRNHNCQFKDTRYRFNETNFAIRYSY